MTTTLIGALLILTPQAQDANKAAEELMAKLSERLKAVKAISGTMEGEVQGRKEVMTFKALKPNFFLMKMSEGELYVDGKQTTVYDVKSKMYMKNPGAEMPGLATMFFGYGDFLGPLPIEMKASNLRTVKVGDKELQAVDLNVDMVLPGTPVRLLVDPATGLPFSWNFKQGEEELTMTYKNVVLGAPLTAADFRFVPPAGAKEAPKAEPGPPKPAEPGAPEPAGSAGQGFETLKKGVAAPAFSLKTPEGTTLAVNAASLKKNKATIVNFWFYG